MRKPVLSTLIVTLATSTMLAGCGMNLQTGASISSTAESVGFDALASVTLRKSFKDLHTAIFQKIDTNGDKYIDEYEAGPYFDLVKEFPKAAGKSGKTKISRTEFVNYATAGGFLSSKDTPQSFMDRMRSFLASAFSRLDKPVAGSGWFGKGDGYLSADELSDKALASLGLGFAYDKLHVKVLITTFDPGDVAAADKTGDGQLSQAEFEDLYMNTVIKLVNPNYNPNPAPAPDPVPSVDPNPAPSAAPAK